MLANLHNTKKAFLVNLSDDGKINVLGQIPTQNGLFGDLSDKESLDSFENLSLDQESEKKVFKARRNRSRSPKGKKVKAKKSRSVSNGKIILLNLEEDFDVLSVSNQSIDLSNKA